MILEILENLGIFGDFRDFWDFGEFGDFAFSLGFFFCSGVLLAMICSLIETSVSARLHDPTFLPSNGCHLCKPFRLQARFVVLSSVIGLGLSSQFSHFSHTA